MFKRLNKLKVKPIANKSSKNLPISKKRAKKREEEPEENKRLIINARGEKFEVDLQIFGKFDETRLGKVKTLIDEKKLNEKNKNDFLVDICDDFNLSTNEIYFNKNPHIVKIIIEFYVSGRLHYDENICCKSFLDDLKYWGLNQYMFDDCCQMKFFVQKEECDQTLKDRDDIIYKLYKKENFGRYFPKVRELIWNIIDKPVDPIVKKLKREEKLEILKQEKINETNTIACCFSLRNSIEELRKMSIEYFIEKIYTTIYVMLVILAVTGSILRTIPSFDSNKTINTQFDEIEYFCMVFFTIEYIFRLLISPNKLRFFLSPLNCIELLPLISFYCGLIARATGSANVVEDMKEIFKTFLLFKLFRRLRSLNILVLTFKASYKELFLYFSYLALSVLIFSSFIFYFEYSSNPVFSSIPAAFWWALITLTTVGYGDIYPITDNGKLIGAITAISGIILLAMPVSLLANSFTNQYKENEKTIRILKIHLGRKKLEQDAKRQEVA